MSVNTRTAVWTAFLLSTLLTWLVHPILSLLWMVGWQFVAQQVLAIASIILGIAILAPKGRTVLSIILVISGLVVGQWWFIEDIAVQIIWRVRGFAP